MTSLRDIARQSMEAGRIAGLDSAIDAAKELGHEGLVPTLVVLRDWPRAGALPRQSQDGRMQHGHIKTLVTDKGYGFITPQDGSQDIFFHRTACASGVNFDRLKVGDQVQYEDGEGPKGRRAQEVELA